jgi:hypothetical protein
MKMTVVLVVSCDVMFLSGGWFVLVFERQQFADAVDWMSLDPCEDIGEPCLRVDAVFLCGAEEGVNNGCVAGRIVTAGEEVVLASYGDGTDLVLGEMYL